MSWCRFEAVRRQWSVGPQVGEVERLLQEAETRRRVGGTAANERSNRSHCVLQIHIHSFALGDAADDPGPEEPEGSESGGSGSVGRDVKSTLAFVDLAGSERVARTAASGLRLQEARNINKSLLGLSQLVKALEKASITGGAGAAAQQHLPYRDTKLTQLLQPSLSGAGRTVIICCVCLSDIYLEETARTLHFARSVRHIQLQPTPQVGAAAHQCPIDRL